MAAVKLFMYMWYKGTFKILHPMAERGHKADQCFFQQWTTQLILPLNAPTDLEDHELASILRHQKAHVLANCTTVLCSVLHETQFHILHMSYTSSHFCVFCCRRVASDEQEQLKSNHHLLADEDSSASTSQAISIDEKKGATTCFGIPHSLLSMTSKLKKSYPGLAEEKT